MPSSTVTIEGHAEHYTKHPATKKDMQGAHKGFSLERKSNRSINGHFRTSI